MHETFSACFSLRFTHTHAQGNGNGHARARPYCLLFSFVTYSTLISFNYFFLFISIYIRHHLIFCSFVYLIFRRMCLCNKYIFVSTVLISGECLLFMGLIITVLPRLSGPRLSGRFFYLSKFQKSISDLVMLFLCVVKVPKINILMSKTLRARAWQKKGRKID